MNCKLDFLVIFKLDGVLFYRFCFQWGGNVLRAIVIEGDGYS